MKNQLPKLQAASLFFIVLLIVSCTKEEKQEEPPFNVLADVYYQNVLIDGEKYTARAYYAYGDRAIASAVAGTPDGKVVQLDQSSNERMVRFYEPAESEYKTEYPAEGNYEFEIKSWDDLVRRSSDELQKENIGFAEILDFEYEELDNSYDLNWTSVTNAEGYLLKLINKRDSTIYVGEILSAETNFATLIEGEEGTWTGNIEVGEEYTLKLYTYSFDKQAESTTKHLNIQEASITTKKFTWGE